MPKTDNLGLTLTTDDATQFKPWREQLDGQGAGTEASPLSNMQLIDKAMGEMQTAIGNVSAALDTINGEVI